MNKKLITKKYGNYGDDLRFIVSESDIKKGFYFSDNENSLFTDVSLQLFDLYKEIKEDKGYNDFYEFSEAMELEHYDLPNDGLISIDEAKELVENWIYFYDWCNDELVESQELLEYQESNYIEYWSGEGLGWIQEEIEDEIIDLELLKENIEPSVDFYKDSDNNLYLHYKNYYNVGLGIVEDITEEELIELLA